MHAKHAPVIVHSIWRDACPANPGKSNGCLERLSFCSLQDSDRHLTTFITPFGRWQYPRAPQGLLSSGDGYNRRFDEIIANFQRKERCIDDTIHWDVELLNHLWRTIDYPILVGRAGVVINPDKLQLAQRTIPYRLRRIPHTQRYD